MNKINTIIQIILGALTILSIFFVFLKIVWPDFTLSAITSFYGTRDNNGHAIFLVKIKTDSVVDLVVEDVQVSVIHGNGTTTSEITKLEPFLLRWKGFLPKMKDISGEEHFYKTIKTIEPLITMNGIKSGIHDYYFALRSTEPWSDTPIKSWEIKVKFRSQSYFVPKFLTRNTRKYTLAQPEEKDLYFDDSLIQKISDKEAHDLQKEL